MSTFISIRENDARVSLSIDDRIFLGEGLFETMRVVNNKIRYPKQHWQRLREASLFLGMSFNMPIAVWIDELNHLIQLKQLQDGGVKAILSGGSAPRGLLAQGSDSHLFFDVFQYTNRTQALTLVSAPWKRDAKNPMYQLKSVNYLEAILARRYAQEKGADDTVFFNTQEQVTETTVANLFIIKNNQLITPSIESGLLPGIIRQRLLALCKEQGLPCVEGFLDREGLSHAHAAFTTNALQGIRPIRSCDNYVFDIEHSLMKDLQRMLTNDRCLV